MKTNMKTIGLLGGMSWESTLLYYQLLNKKVNQKLGGLSSAPLLLYSFDFAPLAQLMHDNEWKKVGDHLAQGVEILTRAGAQGIALCTNTMHKFAPLLKQKTSLPLLNIIDSVGEIAQERNFKKIGLLGTKFTMQEKFFSDHLSENYGLSTVTPQAQEIDIINKVIFAELCQGQVNPVSQKRIINIIEKMMEAGAEAIVLGCTELTLMLKPGSVPVPLLDTTEAHISMIFKWMTDER